MSLFPPPPRRNTHREIKPKVGWSNVVSGLFGGFTGSYIFSQTIFNLRAGVSGRGVGASAWP
ncbi:unnamed protein product [Scytosiphon promiscuus]